MKVSVDAIINNKDTPANYTLCELDRVLIKYNIKSAAQLDYILSKVDINNLNSAELWESATEIACETLKNLKEIMQISGVQKDLDKNFFYNSAKMRNFKKHS